MTVYLCGPISKGGTLTPEEVTTNILAFNRYRKILIDHNHNVLDPTDIERAHGRGHEWDFYMRKALVMLMQADTILLLPGWEDSKGCLLELHVATALRLVTIKSSETSLPAFLEMLHHARV